MVDSEPTHDGCPEVNAHIYGVPLPGSQ
ncbi:MAG: hypothetical protein ACI9W4_001226, partial [Rhodothermales bacterium]